MGISQITTVKGRWSDVESRLAGWLNSHIDELVVVDVDCPEDTSKRLLSGRFARHPKLTVVTLGPEPAGPYFNHAFARNVGAQAARHEWLQFLDADCRFSVRACDKLQALCCPELEEDPDDREPPLDLILCCGIQDGDHAHLPGTWTVDGQCLVRNAIFHSVNGYNETCSSGFGAEAYDFYQRAAHVTDRIRRISRAEILHEPHGDDVRDRFLSFPFSSDPLLREKAFLRQRKSLADRRERHHRAQPGRPFGLIASRQVVVHRAGTPQPFRAGE